MKIPGGSSAVLGAALILSACAIKQELPSQEFPPRELPPIEEYGSWTDVVPQQTFIEVRGERDEEPRVLNVNDVLANEENLRSALDFQFPAAKDERNLRDRINMIREPYGIGEERFPAALRGLGGVIAEAFLDAALATLDEEGNFDDGKRVYHFVHGRILHYAYNQSPGRRTGSGKLHSITYYTRVTVPIGTPENRGQIISETDAVRWKINVIEDGFSVRDREYDDPMDPFPKTMPFSAAMVNRVNFLGFNYKLWAEGDSIDIDEVARKNHGETEYTVLDEDEKEYDELPENCIDMLWVPYPPDQQRDLRPPSYCLGRCKTPHLINTNT